MYFAGEACLAQLAQVFLALCQACQSGAGRRPADRSTRNRWRAERRGRTEGRYSYPPRSQVQQQPFRRLDAFLDGLEEENIGNMVDDYGTKWNPVVRDNSTDW